MRTDSLIQPSRGLRVSPALLVFGLGAVLLIGAALIHVTQGQANVGGATVVEAIIAYDGSTEHNIVRYIRLPRTVVGVLAGAALATAGVLLQSVTRNPLASPATLGVNAGAYLAVVAATLFAPALYTWSPVLVAFVGGLIAALLVYGLAASVTATPVRLALAGVAVSLALSAVTATLQLFFEEQTAGLFLWGAGTLVQIDWGGSAYLAPRLLAGVAAALALARPLEVLLLGDDVARGLGQNVERTRLLGTLVGVFLAAVAVSVVGPIGFVGLVTPHLVRLMGVRPLWLLLPAAALWGGVVLVGADMVARLVTTNTAELPTGAVTALVGAPFLLWLARRASEQRATTRTPFQSSRSTRRRLPYRLLLPGAVVLLLVVLLAGLMLGNITVTPAQLVEVVQGGGSDFTQRVVWTLRLPRLLVAVLAGASLGVSGLLLQGVVRNPLAGPEIIGITSGAGVGALVLLILIPEAPIHLVPLGAFIGAALAFGLVYAAAWREGVSPERLALVGIAVSALGAAVIQILVVMARLRVAQALVWLSGSTYARGWDDLARLIVWPLLLLPLAWLLARQVDLLTLGDDLARGLGLALERARGLLLALAVALAAAAVATVGTIGFVGLMAPHAARLLLGSRHRHLVPLAALLGAILVVLADTVGRTVLAPKEIPSGLVTSLIGAPYFLWLLWRSRT